MAKPMCGSTERIRMQLSRDLDPATLKDRVRITYSSADSKERGEAQPPSVAFTTNYTKENRALEIRPTEPLERFRLVKLEILEGVKGTDGGADDAVHADVHDRWILRSTRASAR